MITGRGDHDCRHDGFNIEIGPLCHHLIQQFLLSPLISFLLNSFFSRNSSLIDSWVRLVSVVICLNQEPSFWRKLIWSMGRIDFSLDDNSFVWVYSWNNVVNGATNSGWFKSFDSAIVSRLFDEDSLDQPACWNGAIFQYTDQILVEILGSSGVHIDRECSRLWSC